MTIRPLAGFGHRTWTSMVISGVVALIVGVALLVWPGPSILVAAILFGAYLLVSGLTQLFSAFAVPGSGAGRVLLFISGAASIVLAVLAFRHFGEGYAILLLAIWIAVGFVFRGVSAVATAVGEHDLPGRVLVIVFGVISVVAGIVVLAYPFSSIVTLTLVSGVWLVVLGVAEIVSGIGMRRHLARATPGGVPSGAETAGSQAAGGTGVN